MLVWDSYSYTAQISHQLDYQGTVLVFRKLLQQDLAPLYCDYASCLFPLLIYLDQAR